MKYEHIGWMQEGKSDKVWGMIMIREDVSPPHSIIQNNEYVSFWGRRGAKLQTKLVTCTEFQAEEMFWKKTKKGYQDVDKNKLDEVYPEFQSDLEKTAFWATFKI
jgi:predicted DNA-binding WGR domain protein